MKSRSIFRTGVFFLIIVLFIGIITVLVLAENNEAARIGPGGGIQRNQSQTQDHECDCDGDCDDDHEGKQPVRISGAELRAMKISDIATLWAIDGTALLNDIVTALNLKEAYTLENTIDDLRLEYRFVPNQIKMIADSLVS